MYQVFEYYYSKKRNQLSLVELDESSVQKWIKDVEQAPLGEASQQVFIMLLEVLQLRHTIVFRLELLDYIAPITLKVIQRLEYQVHQQEYLKQDVRYTQMIELLFGLRGLFIQNYVRINQEATNKLKNHKIPVWNISKRKKIQNIMLHSAKMILESCSVLVYQQHSLDLPYLNKQWYVLHQVYVNTWLLGLGLYPLHITKYIIQPIEKFDALSHHKKTLKQPKTEIVLSNIDYLYKQILIFSIVCQRQLNTSDIEQLYDFTYDWAEYVDFTQKEQAHSKYKINFFEDMLPLENTQENQKVPAEMYVSLERLVQVVSLRYNYSRKMSSMLNFRIQQVLLQSHERQYQRYRYYSNLDLYLGFVDSYRYLQQHSEANHQVRTRYDIVRYHAEVEDKSAYGYKAIWLDDIPSHLKVGEYVLLKEQSDVESKIGWQSGVIRRASRMLTGKMEIGVEILAREQKVCEIRFYNTSSPAVLLYQYSEGERWSLIFPVDSKVPLGQKISLLVEQKEMQIYVSKALLSTQNFVQSEFKLHQDQDVEFLRAIFSE